jgi:hypothetical protein
MIDIILIIVTILTAVVTLLEHKFNFLAYAHIGIISAVICGLSLMMYILKIVLKVLKKKEIKPSKFLRKTFQFFQQKHVIFGWLFFILGLAHSLYFLPKPSHGHSHYKTTGVIAFALMFILVGLGLMLEKKWLSPKQSRLWHKIVGILFTVATLLHIILK